MTPRRRGRRCSPRCGRSIDPYIAAHNDLIDDIIDPRETRPTIIRGLRMAANKRVQRPWKKHGVMPV